MDKDLNELSTKANKIMVDEDRTVVERFIELADLYADEYLKTDDKNYDIAAQGLREAVEIINARDKKSRR